MACAFWPLIACLADMVGVSGMAAATRSNYVISYIINISSADLREPRPIVNTISDIVNKALSYDR